MGYVAKFKKEENEFSNLILTNSNESIIHANDEEDMFDHWDIKLETKFDVKAVKKVNRADLITDENIHWVELINVHGKLGWLYGKADYFAFELDEYWIVVGKNALQKFIAEKLFEKIKTEKPALYKIYTRAKYGKKDQITLVKTIDLMFIAEQIIKK